MCHIRPICHRLKAVYCFTCNLSPLVPVVIRLSPSPGAEFTPKLFVCGCKWRPAVAAAATKKARLVQMALG